MSAPKRTFRGHRIAAIAVVPVALAAAAFVTLETSASPREPSSAYPEPLVPHDWLEERRGYPGYADQSSPTGLVPDDWPDEGSGYPGFADLPSPTGTVSNQGSGLDTTSVALGALGGIALGGAGLGITLAVQRRHDHASLPTA
jgi:hypothetical protein